ncbi:peptide methionine sulfoxide reductase [Cephaloticoccus capnophilus]|uniref:Peptide methionine sulfoxide reductase MsrA n=2 Tax=Cephaloticoccus capnophilus TaxID=1548208 RepID=A0A139SRQ3_9BACT|nr:peptide methionine sulfoxide reductase [Cephaloticoccus capnophilus]
MSATALLPTSLLATTETLVLGGGCFWCTEAAFKLLPGVTEVTSGYAGGVTDNPSYEEVCAGHTGHAEVIRIQYNPQEISLERLLDFFWEAHDPTTLNRQGADAGTQYRSIILYQSPEQKAAAAAAITRAQPRFSAAIVTELVPLARFWPAEDYHQDYFRKNPQAGYCRLVIAPKVQKLEKAVSR